MKKIFLAVFLFAGSLYAKNIALPDDRYDIIESKDIEFVYAKEFDDLSLDILEKEQRVIDEYQKSFGYRFDDKLYLGLLSSKNQIANAFSTQMPLNMQMDYIAGAMEVDYFASKSWIDMLLFHESAHNFQLNPKKNLLSRYAHKIIKNSFYSGVLIPIFPIPNNMCSSFNLEGNAVLNESLHNNGGRLYNGYLKAMVVTQAKSGYITPQRTYNQHLFFPYGTHNYIVGGFFHLFLAQKYGIDRVNRYFYNFSGQWIPIFTNNIFKESFGKDFEELISEYESWLLDSSKEFRYTEFKPLFISKSLVRFNSDKDEIYFVVSNAKEIPNLVRVSKKSAKYKTKKTTLASEKIFRIKDRFYALRSGYVDPKTIAVGLFDESGKVYKKSLSKAIQYISEDGKDLIYFDIKNSLDRPLAYHNDTRIDYLNSSVFRSDSGDIYYFKQNKDIRELYKNKKLLYKFRGYFGYLCDVDKRGRVYFVANSKDGSTLYRLDGSVLKRVLDGDDIVDARLMDDGSAFVESIDGDGYRFGIVKLLDDPKSAEVYEYSYHLKNYSDLDKNRSLKRLPNTAREYIASKNMHYSSTDMSLTYSSNNSVDFDLGIKFSDPLGYNTFSLFGSKFYNDTIIGAGYDNSEHRLGFGLAGFKVVEHDKNESNRGYGASFYLKYPLYKMGYRSVESKLSYTVSDDRDDRSDLIFTMNFADKRSFGHSFYLNYGNFLDLSLGLDRGDMMYGIRSYFARELGSEWYMNFTLGGAYSEQKYMSSKRGIKIESYVGRFDNALNFTMPSLKQDIYVNGVIQSGVSLKKVLNFNRYFFTFPISLRREALYGTYNNYEIKLKGEDFRSFNEFRAGAKFDLLYFNNLALPFSMEYIYNPDLKDKESFRVLFDLKF